jgi:antitoxin VapB
MYEPMERIMTKTARVFSNGGSRAVRLPAEFRFDSQEVYVRRDERTGDVILSTRPGRTWADFMQLRTQLGGASAEFMADREQQSQDRDAFADWKE